LSSMASEVSWALTATAATGELPFWLPSLRKGQSDWQVMLSSLASLYVRGVKVDWLGVEKDSSHSRLMLPTYPFQRQRYWFASKTVENGDRTIQKPIEQPEIQTAQVEMTLEQRLLSLIAKTTGIPLEQVRLDMSLEAELGLDSIVMAQFASSILKLVPEEQKTAFKSQVSMRDLMQLHTLRQVLEVLEPWQTIQAQKLGTNSLILEDFEPISSQREISEPESTIIQTSKTTPVELLDGQYFHLLGYWLVNSTSLFSTVRIKGAFDLDIAWESWKDLIARHPMLRSRFYIPENATCFRDYRLEVLDDLTPPEIPLTDIRHLDKETQEQHLEEEIHRWLNYQWSLTECPLHQFSVFRLEDSVYQIFLGNEHIISDGLGNHIIWREFLEIYRAKVCGETPLLPPPTTIEEYSQIVAAMNSWQDADEDRALAEYTLKQGKESYFWNPQGTVVTSTQPHFYSRKYSLDRETTDQLIAKTREWRLPVNSLLLGAFLRAVVKCDSASNPIIVQVPTGGRVYPGVDASHVISSFAQNLALSFTPPQPDESWSDLLYRLHQEVQKGIASGIDRAQTRQMGTIFRDNISLEDGKIPEHSLSIFQGALKSNLYFPYTGHTHIKTQYGFLEVTSYQAGGINAAGTIDILQEIFDGCLHLFASYDYSTFSLYTIDRLMQEYIAQIEELIRFSGDGRSPLPSFKVGGENSFDCVSPTTIESTLLQIASEICHYSITAEDINKDLEADLGFDSLERIRIVTRLHKENQKSDRKALLNARTLQEMLVIVTNEQLQVTKS
jgi:acyl carrier protein